MTTPFSPSTVRDQRFNHLEVKTLVAGSITAPPFGTQTVTGGQVVIDGTNAAADAVTISASNAAGGIDINSGTGGILIDSNGSVALLAKGTAVDAVDIDAPAGGIAANSALQLALTSSQNSTNAILLNASNALAGIDLEIAGMSTLAVQAATVGLGGGVKLTLDTVGADAVTGTATLAAGTIVVATTSVAAGSLIFLTRNTPGGTVGNLSAPVASITAGVSFVINSDNVLETSTVNWWIIN